MDRLDRLIHAMVDYYRGDAKQIQHFTKVHTYARWIARWEGVEPRVREILDAVTLTHDIGIKAARDKHGTSTWKLQEEEGPPAARAMLAELGFDQALTDRVCWLIGHHHTYTRIEGLDYRILVEADFLVNLQEGNQPLSAVPRIYREIFRTESGKELLKSLYGYDPESPEPFPPLAEA